jgi:hypothetical protein
MAESGAEDGVPLAWTVLGSEYHSIPGPDYVAVAERLVAAGAALEARFVEFAHGPLADWLDERIET